MKILKHGKYQRNPVVTCHHCGCEFKIEYGECLRNNGSPHVVIDCPECGESIIMHEEIFSTNYPGKKSKLNYKNE